MKTNYLPSFFSSSLIISSFLFFNISIYSQASGDYRSATTGNWSALTTWQRYNGSTWVQPTAGQGVPSSASGIITILSGHIVTLATANQSADQMTINAGGQVTINSGRTLNINNGTGIDLTVNGSLVNSGTLTINTNATLNFGSGSTYQHSQNGGAIPTATWNATSTCSITGVTTTNPTNMGQTFGNLSWNCPSQSSDANFDGLFNLAGNLTVTSTGSGIFRFASGTTNIDGNYFQSGGIVRLANTTNRVINIKGNFSMTGGELRMSVGASIGTINVNGNYSQTAGTITETSTGSGLIAFNGSDNQNYTGGGTILNTINFTINNPAGITLLTSVNFPATLTMTQGNINTGSNILTLGTATTNLGTLTRTSGTILGNFRRWFNNTTVSNVLFPIGTTSNYRPANISFTTAPTTGGTLTAFFTASNPGTNGLPLNDGGTQIVNVGINGYWTINATTLTGGTYSLDLTADGFSGVSVVSTLRLLKRPTGGSWILQGSHSAGTGSTTTPIVHRTGMSGFSEFGVGGASDNPLPVELTSFSATVSASGINLKWVTKTEVNNFGFEVERAPGTVQSGLGDWQKIGFVEGSGNSNSPKEYFFSDKNASYGKYSYRLKQVDNDGSFEYSNIVEVNAGEMPGNFILEQNYPNPFNPVTTIKFAMKNSELTTIKIYDVIGNEVAEIFNSVTEPQRIYEIKFDGSNLPSGFYIYSLRSESYNSSKKMLLLK